MDLRLHTKIKRLTMTNSLDSIRTVSQQALSSIGNDAITLMITAILSDQHSRSRGIRSISAWQRALAHLPNRRLGKLAIRRILLLHSLIGVPYNSNAPPPMTWARHTARDRRRLGESSADAPPLAAFLGSTWGKPGTMPKPPRWRR